MPDEPNSPTENHSGDEDRNPPRPVDDSASAEAEMAGVPSHLSGDSSFRTETYRPLASEQPPASHGASDSFTQRYKLIEQIGEGGMGTVWRASQVKPVRREVAVKLIKPGMDSKSVLARFDAERQALAIMDHPNIARVLDGGMTEDGRPYFVMELVRGLPLTDYCDQKRLTIQQRLELFAQICSAVQHAHQKGIMHRDLKPTNILVTEVDNKPVPKVIDFGLAKALGSSAMLTDHTLNTGYGMLLGTPLYMAPEQMDAGAMDIDTRADIYSLGVILYELLTGSTPFDRRKFKNAALDEIKRIVREEEPLKPSSRLSSIDTLPSVAATRQSEPVSLHRLVRGELDWIVMKSLEKDRNRRYETANALSADVKRYLTEEPVMAAPPSPVYRIRKFVHKNRGPVIAASLVMLTFLAGMAGIGWFAISENRARAAAEQARKLADEKAAEVLIEKQNVERERAKTEAERATLEAENADLARRAAETALEQTETTLARSNYFLAVSRWDAGRAAEARRLLHQIPPKYRNVEWYLDQRRFQGSDLTLYGHAGAVESVAFSLDGKNIISWAWDGNISWSNVGNLKLWDVASGKNHWANQWHSISANFVAYSADGSKIVIESGSNSLTLWDTSNRQALQTFNGHSEEVTCAAFTPDGLRVITGSRDRRLKLWDVSSGQELWTAQGHVKAINGVAFSPNGMQIVSWSEDQTLVLWDAATGHRVRSFQGHADWITSARFSPDGLRIVSGSFDKTIKLWDAASGREVRTIQGHSGNVRCVVFSPDGLRIASGSDDFSLKLWDVADGRCLHTYFGHNDSVLSVDFSPDGSRIVSGSWDATIKLWDTISGQELRYLSGHSGLVESLAFKADGSQIASGGRDSTINLWDAIIGQELRTLRGHTSRVECLAFTPDGEQLVSGSEDTTLKLWDITTGKELRTFRGHDSWVTSLAISPDGLRMVSASVGMRPDLSKSDSLILWDLASGQKIRALKGHADMVSGVAFTSDGSSIISVGRDNILKKWDTVSGKELRSARGHNNSVDSVAFSGDGMRIVCQGGATLELWNATNFDLLQLIDANYDGYLGAASIVALSPDGSRIVTGSPNKTINLWDADSGQELLSLPTSSSVGAVSFNSDGTRLAAGCDNVIEFWNAPKTVEKKLLLGHSGRVNSVAFSPDGSWIISTGEDRTLKLWNTVTGEETRTFEGHTNSVNCAAISPDNLRVVSGGEDHLVKVWDLASGKELRSVHVHSQGINRVGFSHDGSQVISYDHSGNAQGWDLESNQRLDTLPAVSFGGNESPDGRWLTLPIQNQVVLVDLSRRNSDQEQANGKRAARIKPDWHEEHAGATEVTENWFAATFHRAWILKARPVDQEAYDNLHRAYQELLKQDESNSHQLAPLLPPAVKEALALPRPIGSTDGEAAE